MNKSKSADQLIVRVGKACNFKCNFCNVSDNERNVKMRENIDDIVRNFHYKMKYSGVKKGGDLTVTISGGEPSLFKKETIFALKYIKKFLEKRNITPHFEIQTNASLIDMDFAQKLKENGVGKALISFHMIDKEIFEKIIQVSYKNFYKIIEGIHNLHKFDITIITNTILSRENKNNFFETIKFINQNFPFVEIFNIGMIQPHGEALKILEKVYPKYEDVIDEYNKSLFYLKKQGKEVVSHFVGPPACYLGHLHEGLEISENILFRMNFNFSEKYLINNINDKNKIQTRDCEKCLYNNVCSGIWKEYAGLQKLKPINYIVDKNDNFEKNNFAYKLKNKNENLKKIYDGNFRQIIISSDLGNKEEIYEIIKKSTKIGFYKVSLLVNSNFQIEKNIVYTGVSNIQCKKEKISNDVWSFIKNFSEKYCPQFKIDLDFI